MHKRVGLVIFFVHYYIFLRERGDRRVKTVKLLLLTATREGPMVEAIERLFVSWFPRPSCYVCFDWC